MAVFDHQPTRKPPISQIGALVWLRTNLFSSWVNSALTLASLYLLYIMIPPLLDWMFFNASFSFGTVNFFGFEIKRNIWLIYLKNFEEKHHVEDFDKGSNYQELLKPLQENTIEITENDTKSQLDKFFTSHID